MLAAISTWLAAHPVVRGVLYTVLSTIALGVLGAWVNWVTWKPTPEEWKAYQEQHPKRAKWLRVSRAIFPHLRKIPQLKPFIDAAIEPQPKPPSIPPLPLLVLAAVLLLGCPPAARAPSAQSVAALAVNSVALGVRIANEACRDRAQAIFVDGDKQRSLELANKCTGHYKTARAALMAAAYAIDGWSDAENHSKALCALSEATTALSFTVEAVKAGGVWTPPREVAVALQGAAVLSTYVDAKQCEVHP